MTLIILISLYTATITLILLEKEKETYKSRQSSGGGTDDPGSLLDWIVSQGAQVSVNYTVIDIDGFGNYQWRYVVNVVEPFPDNTTWHNQFNSSNLLQACQSAVNGLVQAIQNFKDSNPGYAGDFP